MTYLTDEDRETLNAAHLLRSMHWDATADLIEEAVEQIAARVAAETRESVLGEVEQAFREQAEPWGGRSGWLTSGKHVSDLCVWVVRDLRGGDDRGSDRPKCSCRNVRGTTVYEPSRLVHWKDHP